MEKPASLEVPVAEADAASAGPPLGVSVSEETLLYCCEKCKVEKNRKGFALPPPVWSKILAGKSDMATLCLQCRRDEQTIARGEKLEITCTVCKTSKSRNEFGAAHWRRGQQVAKETGAEEEKLSLNEEAKEIPEKSGTKVEEQAIAEDVKKEPARSKFAVTCSVCLKAHALKKKTEKQSRRESRAAEQAHNAVPKRCAACGEAKPKAEYGKLWKQPEAPLGTEVVVMGGRAEFCVCLKCVRVAKTQVCSQCRMDLPRKKFSSAEWAKPCAPASATEVDLSKFCSCKTCKGATLAAARAESAAPRVCTECGIAKPKAEYSPRQWTSESRSCKTCKGATLAAARAESATPRVCTECGIAKPKAEYSPRQWTSESRSCKTCKGATLAAARAESAAPRVCTACGIAKPKVEYSHKQWRNKTHTEPGAQGTFAGLCQICFVTSRTERRAKEQQEKIEARALQKRSCSVCDQSKPFADFSLKQWAHTASVCRTCMEQQYKTRTHKKRKADSSASPPAAKERRLVPPQENEDLVAAPAVAAQLETQQPGAGAGSVSAEGVVSEDITMQQ